MIQKLREQRVLASMLSALALLIVLAVWERSRLAAGLRVVSSYRVTCLIFLSAASLVILISFLRTRPNRSELFPLLLSKTVSTSRSESVESLDPSSVEFQRSFAAIVNAHRERKRLLVIAIDNLDRVDSSLALQLWATMRTFFEFDFETNPWASSVWLLAAFDVSALQNLWPIALQNGEPHNSHAESFVNKTFQASFSVPPL